MERMILANGSLSDAAILYGATGLGDLTLSNLQRQSLQEVYRFTGGSNAIDVDFGRPVSINTAALIAHTAGPNATCRVTAGGVVGGADFATGDLPMQSQREASATAPQFGKNLFFQFFSPQTFRYWRFTISDPNTSYLDIGRLYLAHAFQPSFNMAYGMTQGVQDMSNEFLTVSGDSISQKRPKRRVTDFSLEDLSEGEAYGDLLVLDQLVGTTGDVLFVPKPDDKTFLQLNAVYGKISEPAPVNWSAYNRFQRQYRIVELVP